MSFLVLPDGTRMDIFGTGGGEQLAQSMQANFLGKVPIDQNVRIGGDSGKPIVISNPDSPVAQALCEIAGKVAANTANIPQLEATAPVLALIVDEAIVQDGYMNALTDGFGAA